MGRIENWFNNFNLNMFLGRFNNIKKKELLKVIFIISVLVIGTGNFKIFEIIAYLIAPIIFIYFYKVEKKIALDAKKISIILIFTYSLLIYNYFCELGIEVMILFCLNLLGVSYLVKMHKITKDKMNKYVIISSLFLLVINYLMRRFMWQ